MRLLYVFLPAISDAAVYISLGLSLVLLVILLVLLAAVLSFRRRVDELQKNSSSADIRLRLEESDRNTREEFARGREETAKRLDSMNALIREMQSENNRSNEKIALRLKESVGELQLSNEKKLDQMRETVDEKLTATLKERISSSFEIVGKQLESVNKSIGEMKEIADDVSDLQRVLTNVKARGTWAEVQLGNILSETLTPSQYVTNVSTKKNGDAVEYAIKIPSRFEDGTDVLLPIDSKFPQEDYIRLVEAAERADKSGVEEALKALDIRIKNEAKKIYDKYVEVPVTTDFAIMFLPTEGLYAEVMRRESVVQEVQRRHIMICGPTTITAFLNTLSMGFKTIAIDKKAAEVWKVLGAVGQQYEKFTALVARAKKNIETAGKTLDEIDHRNSIIGKKLKNVERISGEEAQAILGIDSMSSAEYGEDTEADEG